MKTSTKVLIASFLFFNTNFNAQLTNAEVYDFEIGDVFHTNYTHNNNGGGATYSYTWDTIIGKNYSVNSDTLFYQVKRHNKLSISSGNGTGISYPFTDTTILRIHTNLNSPAEHYVPSNCTSCPVVTANDTVDWCNSTTDMQASFLDSNAFEPNIWLSKLYKGFGGPYYTRTDYTQILNGAPDWNYKLLYSNTSQHGSCGTPLSFASINELESSAFVLYPNPVQNVVNIQTELSDYFTRIISISGKEMIPTMAKNSTSIEVVDLPNGVYIIEFTTDIGVARKRFIKQ